MRQVDMTLAPIRTPLSASASPKGDQTAAAVSFTDILATLASFPLQMPADSQSSMNIGEEVPLELDAALLEDDSAESILVFLESLSELLSPVNYLMGAQIQQTDSESDESRDSLKNNLLESEISEDDLHKVLSKLTDWMEKIKVSEGKLPQDLQQTMQRLLPLVQSNEGATLANSDSVPQAEMSGKSPEQLLGLLLPLLKESEETSTISSKTTSEEGANLELRSHYPLAPMSVLRHQVLAPPIATVASNPIIHSEQLLPEMTEFFVSKVQIVRAEGFTDARLTLFPEQLGQLDVKISLHQGQLTAQFVAENAFGRDLLESNLNSLRAALQQHGLQVDKLEVVESKDASSFLNQQEKPRDQTGGFKKPKQQSSLASLERTSTDPSLTPYERTFSYGGGLLTDNKKIDFSA